MLIINESISIPSGEMTLTFSRAGGPGGQNVNKVSSRVTLHWDVEKSESLPEPIRQRFLAKYRNRITTEGALVLHSQRYRDQARNIEDCMNKLREMILAVEKPPTPRKRTKPSRGANQRRLKEKKQRSERKQRRQRPRMGD